MKDKIIDIIRKFHLTNEIKTYNEAAEQILRLFDVTESVCDNCEPVSGFYLGVTCPKCNRPLRSVKQTSN